MEIVLPRKIVPMHELDRINYLKEIRSHRRLAYATHWHVEIIAPENDSGFKIAFFLAYGSERILEIKKPYYLTIKSFGIQEAKEKLEEITQTATSCGLEKIKKELEKTQLIHVIKRRRRMYFIPRKQREIKI